MLFSPYPEDENTRVCLVTTYQTATAHCSLLLSQNRLAILLLFVLCSLRRESMAEAAPSPAPRQSPSRRVGCLLAIISSTLVIVCLGVSLLTYPLWMPWISGYFSPWPESPSPTTQNLHSIAMVSATNGWAVGDYGTILHYTGSQWTQVNSPTFNDLYSVAMVSASEGWAVGGF